MHVVVVGAGIAGLVAARELEAAGASALVVDKGRSPGGRMATRRLGAASLDHGAQFFTVRDAPLGERVADWVGRGLLTVWSHGFGDPDGHPRYVATGGMNSLAKDLALGLEVSCATMAFGVRRSPTGRPWDVVIDDATTRPADHVVITTPLPQAYALLADSGIELDESLMRTDYDRTLALLAVLDRPPAVPAPGGLQSPSAEVAFVADNQAKGVSAIPALTLHASPSWSEEHWDDDLDPLTASLTALAGPWLGPAKIVESNVKKWRFATPRSVWPEACWVSPDGGIVLAGDAFAGPRVEGAFNSGLAAACALLGADSPSER